MPKITIIGAGSLTFSHRMMVDCLSHPAMRDAQFALVDIDASRLPFIERLAARTLREGGYDKASFTLHTDRREALPDTDFIVISILVGGWQPIHNDIDIPMKYGIDQTIGDTTGPGGVFRMLRTAPHIVGMANDIMELCPDAIVLNYTNPMSMLTGLAYGAQPRIRWVGLCHSVQGTAHEWCERIGVPLEEVEYLCAGINHMAWFTRFERNGTDLLPAIREKAVDPAVWKSDTSRCEYVKHFGYPITESCGHNSEYSWWFRKRPDLLPIYCDPENNCWNRHGFLKWFIKEGSWVAEMEKVVSNPEPIDFKCSPEYGSRIMNAKLTGEPVVIYGNVPNTGLIPNLQQGGMVEVPVRVDAGGLHPAAVPELPPQCAALDRAQMAVHDMAVRGWFARDPEMIFHAIAYDPLTAAVCSLDEIRDMVAEMFEAQAPHMPEFQLSLDRKARPWK